MESTRELEELYPLPLVPHPAIRKIHAALLHQPLMLGMTPHVDGFRLYFVPLRVPPVRVLQIPDSSRPAFLEIAQPLSKRDDGSHRTPTDRTNQRPAALVISRGRKFLAFMARLPP